MSKQFSIVEDGAVWLAGRELHPATNPLAAAHQELTNLLTKAESQDTLVIAGSGLGWHARAVLDLPNHPHVLIYEPDPQRRAMLKALGPSLNEAELLGDQDALTAALGSRLVYNTPYKVAVYAAPAYHQGLPELVQEAKDLVSKSLERRRTDQQTRYLKQKTWWQHALDNFNLWTSVPEITPLANVFRGTPALVLGAGPSLEKSLPLLKNIRHKGLVLAAASAIGPMAKWGEKPHKVFALEGKDESRQFQQADFTQTWLAAASGSHPNHFRQWQGSAALFHLEPWFADLSRTTVLPTGGHATSAAFAFAVLLGCNPIILVGQDLAYVQGRQHAEGRPGGEDEQRPPTLMVPAIGGGEVESSTVLQSYIMWYQEAAAYLKERHPERRVINTTAQGAFIPGFEHQPLTQVLNGVTSNHDYYPKLDLRLKSLSLPKPDTLLTRLDIAQREIKTALDMATDGSPAKAISNHFSPNSVVYAALSLLPGQAKTPETNTALQEMYELLQQMAEKL